MEAKYLSFECSEVKGIRFQTKIKYNTDAQKKNTQVSEQCGQDEGLT